MIWCQMFWYQHKGNLREDLKERPGDVLEPLDDLEKVLMMFWSY